MNNIENIAIEIYKKTLGYELDKLDTKSFISRMIDMYGDVFDYSKVNYINNHTKVCLIKKCDGSELWRTPQVLMRKKNKIF